MTTVRAGLVTPAFVELAGSCGAEVLLERSFLTFRSRSEVAARRRNRSCPPAVAAAAAAHVAAADHAGSERRLLPAKDDMSGQVSDARSTNPSPRSTTSASSMRSGSVVARELAASDAASPAPLHGTAGDAVSGGAAVSVGAFAILVPARARWADDDAAAAFAPSSSLPSPQLLLSQGSADHGRGLCRPCIYFAHDVCMVGDACTFCHVPNHKSPWRRPRPPKHVRQVLRQRAAGTTQPVALQGTAADGDAAAWAADGDAAAWAMSRRGTAGKV